MVTFLCNIYHQQKINKQQQFGYGINVKINIRIRRYRVWQDQEPIRKPTWIHWNLENPDSSTVVYERLGGEYFPKSHNLRVQCYPVKNSRLLWFIHPGLINYMQQLSSDSSSSNPVGIHQLQFIVIHCM